MNYNNLNENSKKIIQSKNVKVNLMEHQKTAVSAMINLEKDGILHAESITQYGDNMDFSIETTIGILADKVGSGKSLMVLSLIDSSKKPPQRDPYWIGSRFIAIKAKNNKDPINTNLLIVPQKLIHQWEEFFKWVPNINYTTFKDNIDDITIYDVIIVTCTKSTPFFKKFNEIKWSRIIVDEADSIKLASNTLLNCSFLWLVTATPKPLRYSNKPYLSPIFKNIIPWVFDYIIVKNNDDFIDKSIVLPTPKRIIIPCLTPKEINIIKNFIPKTILTMINAGNSEEAIKILNCNVNTNDNILKVITSNISNAVNNKKLELEFESKKNINQTINLKVNMEQKLKIKKIERCIERLETRYNSIKEKIYNLNDQYCPICMDEFTTPTIVNCCHNIFCFECIALASSKNSSCPFCRKTLYKENLNIISDKPVRKQIDEKKEKIDVIIELIENNPQGRFLVFANNHKTFEKINSVFLDKKISSEILKGSSLTIQKTIDDFSNGIIKVIMLNVNYFGSGMNLQMATHVVIFHRFEKELEEQVIGRAQRLGRIDPLNVVYLIHENEDEPLNDKNKFEDMDYQTWLEEIEEMEEIEEIEDHVEIINNESIDIMELDTKEYIEIKPKTKYKAKKPSISK